MASTLALQCSTIWAMKTHTLGAGQFVEFILTRPWKEWHLKMMWTAEIKNFKWRYHRDHRDDNIFILSPAILTYRLLLRMRRMYVASIRLDFH